MLHLLIDTSTWLDMARRRDGQRWIVAIRVLVLQNEVRLLVPSLIIDEFERNRERIETSMTASISQRFKQIRQDLQEYGGEDDAHAYAVIEDLGRHLPLVGGMTTRNFDEILDLLRAGHGVEPNDETQARVVERGLAKKAPFHRGKNSVADALLLELYGEAARAADLNADPHVFATTNSDDFSLVGGDKREPHPDFAELFEPIGSHYVLGVDGLDSFLRGHFGDGIDRLFADTEFQEEPRRLDEIIAAEQELFDRIWYHRSLQRDYRLEADGECPELEGHQAIARPGRERIEAKYVKPGELGPYSDFELGMLNGKLSAIRWVLGSEWDFLDT